MSSYPKRQWKDILTIISGKSQKEVQDPKGKYPIYGSGGEMGRANDFLCPANTVIVGRKGTIDNPIYVDKPFWNIDTAFGVVAGKELMPKYLYYFCQLFNFKSLDKSTGRPSLAKSDLLKIEMPVPAIDTQQQIVSHIEELFSDLDDGVATLEKTKKELELYRQVVVQRAFRGEYTNGRHIRTTASFNKAPSKLTDQLPEIPAEWSYVRLAELGDLGRGRSQHRPRNDKKLFENGQYPFLQTGEIKNAKNIVTEFSKQYNEFGLEQSKMWPRGTLCITIAANIAETAILGIDACFPDSVVGFSPYENVDLWYIRYFIYSQKVRLWAYAPATAQKNINLTTLENLIVPYCDIQEQREIVKEIVDRLSVCDEISASIETALQQASSLRQSILKKAFEGELVHE